MSDAWHTGAADLVGRVLLLLVVRFSRRLLIHLLVAIVGFNASMLLVTTLILQAGVVG